MSDSATSHDMPSVTFAGFALQHVHSSGQQAFGMEYVAEVCVGSEKGSALDGSRSNAGDSLVSITSGPPLYH